MAETLIYWIAAALIGALVGGVGGVVSRYKRAPFSVLLTLPALAYLLCNAVASIFALALPHYVCYGTPRAKLRKNLFCSLAKVSPGKL